MFHPLEEEHLIKIVDIMVGFLSKRLKDNGIEIEITEEAKALLAKEGFDQVFGARPLRRAIQSMVEDKLAEEMLEGRVKAGDRVVVERDGDELVVKRV